MVLFSVTVPSLLRMPPPSLLAELPDRVLQVSVAVPWLRVAPPSPAVLPGGVLLVTVRVPIRVPSVSLRMPPPPKRAELPDRVLLTSVTVPPRWLKMPPPEAAEFADRVLPV